MKPYFKGIFLCAKWILIIAIFKEPGVRFAGSFKVSDALRIFFKIIS